MGLDGARSLPHGAAAEPAVSYPLWVKLLRALNGTAVYHMIHFVTFEQESFK